MGQGTPTDPDPELDQLSEFWPMFGLRIQTPRVSLRLPRETELCALLKAARIISGPGESRLHLPWMYDPSPEMERQFLQQYWRALALWKPESWHLQLAIYRQEQPIGLLDMWAVDFARVRSVGTGSWITRSEQGRGYGTEARAAVLELAFGQLRAEEALTEYLAGNDASSRVSGKLHYTQDGQRLVYRRHIGRLMQYRLRLDRQTWLASRSGPNCVITGIGSCLAMFGADDSEHAEDSRHAEGGGA